MGSRFKPWTLQDVEKAQGLPITRKGMKHANPEYQVCVDVSDYMEQFHPQEIVHFDYGSGLKMTKIQAAMQKRINKWSSYPDLFVCSPNKEYHGLFIEIKTKDNNPYTRSGKLKSDEHIRKQAAMLDDLNARGYYAVFGVGFERIVLILTGYFSKVALGRLPKPIIHFR